jgi:ATP-dependent helicase HrpB
MSLDKSTQSALPINELRSEITSALASGNRLIIRAPTGSGKSTQVPQFILDDNTLKGRILILQPRRLAARMLAARVAEERGCVLGEEIGFQTRFESAVSEKTRACFITEGILPRMLLNIADIPTVSTIIFDEFHERSLTSDVGLALAADLQRTRRPDLRIVVMSATIDVGPLKTYLDPAAIITSEGRVFPIDIRYSPAIPSVAVWNHAAQAAAGLVSEGKKGDILIFMPGVYEIRRTVESVENAVRGEPVTVLPLYGDLPGERQNRVMDSIERRKIIVATNIAETSLTIPGMRHVIDSGLARVNRFDSARGFNTLFTESISRDSADHRAGRAGREAAGICVRLWSISRQAALAARTTPEILRVDLAEIALAVRRIGYDSLENFPWFERPAPAAIALANETLEFLGATDASGALTPLANEMSGFPMHPRLSRLLIEAGKRKCAHLAAFCAAIVSERSALAGKPDFPEEAYQQDIASDFFGQYCLLKKIEAGGFDPMQCARYAVNASAAKNILRMQALFLEHCRRAGMHTRDDQNAPTELARCLLLAFPDHLAVRKDKGTLMCALREGRKGMLDEKSMARSARMVVAADIREIKDKRGDIKTVLSLATEIKEEWLQEHFKDSWTKTSNFEWNPSAMAVENRMRVSCLGVVLEEKAQHSAVSEEASTLLAETIIAKQLVLPLWDQSVGDFIGKVQWVSGQFQNEKLPEFNDGDRRLIVHELCEGEYRYNAVCEKPVLPVVQSLLDARQRRFVEDMAPHYIELPSGRKLRIFYDPKDGPRARARIQDLYGMQSTPRVAGGRAAVLIEALAPNNRPVQITLDLANFWAVHYPKLKTSLARRYPRHEWR